MNTRARPQRRLWVWVGVGIVVVALGTVAWIGTRALLAYDHLQTARAAAVDARAQLTDPQSLHERLDALAVHTAAARHLTSDPLWSTAEHIPWIGRQLAAVSTAARALDEVAGHALLPLAAAAEGLTPDALTPTDGRMPLEAFEELDVPAQTAATRIASALSDVRDVDRAGLLPVIRDAIADLEDQLRQVDSLTQTLARAVQLLPAMLGGDGPREYLMLFQNNAEWRSLGGIPGAMVVIRADDGRLSITAQDTAAAFARSDEPIVDLGEEVEAIFGARPALWMLNATQVPQFDLAARMALAWWEKRHGDVRDGVIALDPVTLGYLLTATGPVALPDGALLTADNAVPLLLSEVYTRYPDPPQQDAFFAAAAVTIFDALTSGAVDPVALVAALGRAADERRLLVWSAAPDEAALLHGTTLAGDLPADDDRMRRFGVYLNDGTGSKMDLYQWVDAELAWDDCRTDASGVSGSATLTLTIVNDAPADAATLPDHITGGGGFGVEPGIVRTAVYVYLPTGFELTGARITPDGGFGGGTHDGRRVVSFVVDLTPGASATAEIGVRTDEPGAAGLEVLMTPTAQPAVAPAAVCG